MAAPQKGSGEGTAWNCVREKSGGGKGKALPQRTLGMAQLSRDIHMALSCHGSESVLWVPVTGHWYPRST